MNILKFKKEKVFLVLILNLFFATKSLAYEFNKVYDCYSMNGNSLKSWTIKVSEDGKILDADKLEPKAINIFNKGKCEIQEAKHYMYRHPSGKCPITIYKNGDYFTSCSDTNNSINDEFLINCVNAGKCELIREDK